MSKNKNNGNEPLLDNNITKTLAEHNDQSLEHGNIAGQQNRAPYIIKINDLKHVLEVGANLCFFDIEETILEFNSYFALLAKEPYKQVFSQLCPEGLRSLVIYHGKNYKRYLLQNDTPEIINTLKANGAKVFALTSGYPSRQKRERIVELGVDFHGYLFTKGLEKGPFLVNFFKTNNFTGTMLFVDNHEYKLQSVGLAFRHYKINCEVNLFLYERVSEYKVTLEDFTAYWSRVVQAVEAGEFENLPVFKKRKYKKFHKY